MDSERYKLSWGDDISKLTLEELDDYFTLEDLESEDIWQPPICDSCEEGTSGTDRIIVRQHTMDGKLCCNECWAERLDNARKVSARIKELGT